VVSAHRMPDDMFAYAEGAAGRGLKAIIAGAGGAAHLPGMLAAKTTVPVLGVPVASKHLQGVDSLHSIVQMPKGMPVATFAIGVQGPPMPRCLPWPCWPTKMPGLARQAPASAPRRPKRRAP
jgi:5-(carboxyamino)imidazole ribonucleotide mutase